MGRADHADVHLPALLPSHPANGPRLERPEQLRLELERQRADLVEEERASVRQLEEPGLGRDGAGKGAALVAEQLALEQVGRDRRAVDLDERAAARASAAVVNGARKQLLAGTGLAADQDRDVAMRSDPRRLIERLPQGGAPAEDRLEAEGAPLRLGEPAGLDPAARLPRLPLERAAQESKSSGSAK